jgi:uncharacterized protein (UPF0333 family)
MRKSRVLLAGVAVAAAGAATSAFTASNTVPSSTAGYAAASVTGATAANITYQLDATDKSLVDSVKFDITQNITGMQAWLTLRNGGTSGSVVGTPINCSVGARTTVSPVTCTFSPAQAVNSFDAIGLTVAQ